MELCLGSMLDYCHETLDKDVASRIKATDIMWKIINAIDYLDDLKINHGDLKLENVLFWKRDSKSRWVLVKLTAYGYSSAVYARYLIYLCIHL
jgi:serine/threonine protein kinase